MPYRNPGTSPQLAQRVRLGAFALTLLLPCSLSIAQENDAEAADTPVEEIVESVEVIADAEVVIDGQVVPDAEAQAVVEQLIKERGSIVPPREIIEIQVQDAGPLEMNLDTTLVSEKPHPSEKLKRDLRKKAQVKQSNARNQKPSARGRRGRDAHRDRRRDPRQRGAQHEGHSQPPRQSILAESAWQLETIAQRLEMHKEYEYADAVRHTAHDLRMAARTQEQRRPDHPHKP